MAADPAAAERIFDIAIYYSEHANQFHLHQAKMEQFIDVSPLSEMLAWFTNTKNYRNWVESDGGWLYYPVTPRTAQGRGKMLIGALPASWKKHPPLQIRQNGTLSISYFDCVSSQGYRVDDILRSLICQALVACFETSAILQECLSRASSEVRGLFEVFPGFENASWNQLYDLLHVIIIELRDSKKAMRNLFIIKNIHNLNREQISNNFLRLRVALERLQVHTLVTGKRRTPRGDLDWGSDELATIDEDTEYEGTVLHTWKWNFALTSDPECLESLRFDGLYTRRDQVAQAEAGTNQWIWSHPAFQAWNKMPSGILWIQGKPGSGKSVLAKSIVRQLAASRSLLVASWFYSRRGGNTGISDVSMMRSISYQLLSQCRLLFRFYQNIYRKCDHHIDLSVFSEFLRLSSTQEGAPDILCIIDGMDESGSRDTEQGKRFLGLSAELVENPISRLKIMILSRPYGAIERAYGTYDILLEVENFGDIEKVVDAGLRSLRSAIHSDEELPLFAQRRRAIREGHEDGPKPAQRISTDTLMIEQTEMEIMRSYLLENARGVILWVSLCIGEAIRYAEKLYKWTALRKRLTDLPLELNDMYKNIMSEITQSSIEPHQVIARKIFAWVMAASTKRPLLLKELLDALALPDFPAQMNGTNLAEDLIQANRPPIRSWSSFSRSLRELCGPFVEVINPTAGASTHLEGFDCINGESVVQLLHQTVKEFLENDAGSVFTFRPHEAYAIMNKDAERYLHLALPLEETKYAPVLQDFGDSWKSSVEKTIFYLEDKVLLKFIISNCLPSDSLYLQVAPSPQSPSPSKWMLSVFFHRLRYKDLDIDHTTKDSVVGRCFWLACTHGLSTAVDNLLYASSLCPGWWYVHRDVVLNGALLAAHDHGLSDEIELLTHSRDRFISPAIRRVEAADLPSALLRSSRRLMVRGLFGDLETLDQIPPMITSPPIRRNASPENARRAIRRILDYLDAYTPTTKNSANPYYA